MQIFALLSLAVCVYAIAAGGAPERIVACSFVIAYLLTNIVQSPRPVSFHHLEWGVAAVDGVLLLTILSVACLSTRYWSLLMASMQVVDVLGHASKVLDPYILPRAYFALVAFISFPMVIVLGFGVFGHRRRLRRFGLDYAWASQLPLAYLNGLPAHEPIPEKDGT